MFNPKSEIRLCGGRELNLKDYHDIAFEVANCLMAGSYLTRAEREPGKDEEMAKRLGRELIKNGASFSVSNK